MGGVFRLPARPLLPVADGEPEARILESDLRLTLRTEECANNLAESVQIPTQAELDQMSKSELIDLITLLGLTLQAVTDLGRMALRDRRGYLAALARGGRPVRDVACLVAVVVPLLEMAA